MTKKQVPEIVPKIHGGQTRGNLGMNKALTKVSDSEMLIEYHLNELNEC